LFIGKLSSVSFDAQGDVVMYRLSRPDFLAVLMRYPELEKIVEQLTAEMFEAETTNSTPDQRQLTAAERAELGITTEFIDQVPMFHGLTDPLCVNALAARLTQTTIAANTVVCEKGQIGQEMYFVREGFVEMLPALDQPAFGQKGPGSFFGEMALLNSEPRNAYCRCLTEMSGYVLTKSDLQHVLIEFPAMEAMVRRPLMERETERARVLGEMMAATATTMSRKEQRQQAANALQRAGKRFVERKLEQRAQREAELEALRLSECVQQVHVPSVPLFKHFDLFNLMLCIAETWVSGLITGNKWLKCAQHAEN
jgi:CRP-like cAMP-binding protein